LRANRRGIFALLCATAAFTTNDALTKIVASSYPVGQVMFLRGSMTILAITAALVVLRQIGRILPAFGAVIVFRSMFDAIASATFIAALAHMPIAELSALVLAAPLLMTMMAVLIFKEPVGWRRWGAIIVGLAGTLLVVKPSPSAFDIWAIFGVGAALGAAARDLSTLRIDPAVPTLVIAFFSAVALTTTGFLLGLDESWRAMALAELSMLAIAALFYSIATYLLVLAFRSVEISVVSPFRYSLLIWAGIAGYIGFGELPDRWSISGALLIVASGLYTLHRETVRHRYLSAKPTTEA
jgi:drug/metabolite transporter (DMT)-like permease